MTNDFGAILITLTWHSDEEEKSDGGRHGGNPTAARVHHDC